MKTSIELNSKHIIDMGVNTYRVDSLKPMEIEERLKMSIFRYFSGVSMFEKDSIDLLMISHIVHNKVKFNKVKTYKVGNVNLLYADGFIYLFNSKGCFVSTAGALDFSDEDMCSNVCSIDRVTCIVVSRDKNSLVYECSSLKMTKNEFSQLKNFIHSISD